MPHSRGSDGSLSRASTPKTHSWTRRSGSRRTNRSSPSTPRANSPQGQRPLARQAPRSQPGEVLVGRVVRAVDDPQVLPPAALHGRLDQPPLAPDDEVERLDDHAFAAPAGQLRPPVDPLRLARRVGHVHDLVRRRQQQSRIGPADCGQRLHVPDVVLVRVDAALRSPAGGTGPASGRRASSPASSTAGRRRRTAPTLCSRLAALASTSLPAHASSPLEPRRRPAASAATAAWQRRPRRPPRPRRTAICSSSCALADHGISSQSRHTHVVSNSSQKSGRRQRRPHAGRGTAPPAPASLKNRRPVRVKTMPDLARR